MLTADEDITTELDKVVCRLMKISLRMSRGRNTAPPAKWMQCKLLDLLTLTEKAIERRKKYYIADSLKAIEFNVIDDKLQNITNMNKTKNFDVSNKIVDKYCNIIISPSDATVNIENAKYRHNNTDDDLLSISSNEFLRDLHYVDSVVALNTSNIIGIDTTKPEITEQNALERTKEASKDILEVLELDYECNKSEDTAIVTGVKREQNQLRHMAIAKKDLESMVIKTSNGSSFHKYKSKREERKKKSSSSTRVTKKLARKKYDNYGVVKNPAIKYRTSGDSYNLRPTKRSKVNRCFTISASKPIPESLIDLCHPELKFERDVKEFKLWNKISEINDVVNLNEPARNIAMANNLAIQFVMDNKQKSKESTNSDGEEMPIHSDLITNYEHQVDFSSNDIDRALCTKHHVSTESIKSQTIFLNDINEPSTSKGIRHNVSMDVQCGPDTLSTYPVLSASTSLIRLPPELSTALKIHNNNRTGAHSTEFGTSTHDSEYDNIITPRSRSVGIKIKDSDLTITATNIDIATTIQNFLQPQERSPSVLSLCLWGPESVNNTPVLQDSIINKTVDSYVRTEQRKSLSNILKPEDSFENLPKLSSKFSNAKHVNEVSEITFSKFKDNKPASDSLDVKYNKPSLCCGGVYVHSYKDKQECEDIVYQGMWQQFRPKSARKKQCNSIFAKKINDSAFRGQKNILKKVCDTKYKYDMKKSEQIKHTLDVKKPIQMCINLRKTKQGDNIIKFKSIVSKTVKIIPNLTKPSRSISNMNKVVSKIGISTIASKSVKSAFNAKISQIKASLKKDNVQKMSATLHNRTQNAKLFDHFNDAKVHSEMCKKDLKEQVPLVTLKTDEIKKDLLNINDNLIKNSYLVYCYDKQQKIENSANEKVPVNSTFVEDNVKYTKRTLSPPSVNSSTCSSPNSIVTIRAMKTKNLSQKKHSILSHKSSFNTSDSDNSTPTNDKSFLKMCKSMKKSNFNKNIDNKENVPATRENFNCKKICKSAKSLNLGQHNSVSIAQPNTNRSTTQTTAETLLKNKIYNKSVIEIPVAEKTAERKRSSKASTSRKNSLESETKNQPINIVSNHDLSYSDYKNPLLVIEPQDQSQNQGYLIDLEKAIENSHLDWVQKSFSNKDPSNVRNFIKQFTEELIDNVVFFNDTYSTTINSTTMINSEKMNVEMNESSSSFKTVNTDYCYNGVLENDMDDSFDSMFTQMSISNLDDARLNLLPYTSVTPVSNRSEYFLADNKLNTAVSLVEECQPSNRVLNQTSVADIFERRKQRLIQGSSGFMPVQVFSGFTHDGETVTAGHLDPISLIDSETGSMAVGVARLATSEELFMSSRSSDSFESCVADEDAVVPNWLFNIISQQQSIADDQPLIGPQRAPFDESIYDENGNVIEMSVIDVTTGAGDGRGIHSEPSQDSSGRGTSLSSSDTTSSQLTEALASQFELVHDVASTVATIAATSDFNSVAEYSRSLDNISMVATMDHNRHYRQPLMTASSDIDADISSIGTDVLDSTDN